MTETLIYTKTNSIQQNLLNIHSSNIDQHHGQTHDMKDIYHYYVVEVEEDQLGGIEVGTQLVDQLVEMD
ncbi:hypothetical protein WICPIJ_009618 [Wickerhamomyces pijperi]|uniref:Uncharacterized protein n=1 Tax=Wickerhamomyces pijperi TaxID=599730 RepID=A0A9P8PMK7_WICPI|nr:hypothetical protein WICPIJ_009618 [Wickerhamomyces pijperi]